MKLIPKNIFLALVLLSTIQLATAGGHEGGEPLPDPDPGTGTGGSGTGGSGTGSENPNYTPEEVLYWELSFIGIDTTPNDGDFTYTELSNYSGTLADSLPALSSLSFTDQVNGFDYSGEWDLYLAGSYLSILEQTCSNATCDSLFSETFLLMDILKTGPDEAYATGILDFNLTLGSGANEQLWYLEYSAVTVPVPAAAWLFLSSIVSLAGIRRRQLSAK